MKLTVIEIIFYTICILFFVASIIHATGFYEFQLMNDINKWYNGPATNGTVILVLIHVILKR